MSEAPLALSFFSILLLNLLASSCCNGISRGPWGVNGAGKCLEVAVPINQHTTGPLLNALQHIDVSGKLLKGVSFSWLHGIGNKTAFWPVGSVLSETKASAIQKVTGPPTNSTIGILPRSPSGIGGTTLPLGLVVLDWDSAEIVSNIFRILVEECFNIQVQDNARSVSSVAGIRRLLPCTASRNSSCGEHVVLEIWEPKGFNETNKYHRQEAPLRVSTFHYQGIFTSFVNRKVQELPPATFASTGGTCNNSFNTEWKAWRSALAYYEFYNVSLFETTHSVFLNLSTLFAHHVNLSDVVDCKDNTYMMDHMQSYLLHTNDSDGVELAGGTVLPRCFDGGKVWRSPSCRKTPWRCIPWITTNGWESHTIMQQSYFWQWPIALVDLTLTYYERLGKDSKLLVGWWHPDSRFTSLNQILMPAADPSQHENGLYKTEYGRVALAIYSSVNLLSAAPRITTFLTKFNLGNSQIQTLMRDVDIEKQAGSPLWNFTIACNWVRANMAIWNTWIPTGCNSGEALQDNGLCVQCPPGTFARNSTCHSCASGRFSASHGALSCTPCPDGATSGLGSATCVLQKNDSMFWGVWVLCSSLFGVAALVLACWGIRRFLKTRAVDQPDNKHTWSGNWVYHWVGPHVYPTLRKNIVFRKASSMFVSSVKCCGCKKGSWGGGPWKKWTEAFRKPCWVVNASPFKVSILTHNTVRSGRVSGNSSHQLGRLSFCKVNYVNAESICLTVELQEQFGRPSQTSGVSTGTVESFQIFPMDWEPLDSVSSSRSVWGGKGKARKGSGVRYRESVLRRSLGNESGEVKLVWRQNLFGRSGELLLILWSPPHTLRGVPIAEFDTFLRKVLSHKGTWQVQRRVGGEVVETTSKQGDELRNMYDANKNYIQEEIACFDASYAELHTDYGPCEVFISHVWGETASTTYKSVSKLRESLFNAPYIVDRFAESVQTMQTRPSATVVSVNALRVRSDTTGTSWNPKLDSGKVRVFFCTLCNNQARIAEELGNDVSQSPFAQVLKSSHCKIVAMISPLKALERKWCTYEFCLAVHLGMEPLLVTTEGIVQNGQVAPKSLDELSQRIVAFNSQEATCENADDEVMIDQAVDNTMGGYVQLTLQLQIIFANAISDAHECTGAAHERLQGHLQDDEAQSVRKSLRLSTGNPRRKSRIGTGSSLWRSKSSLQTSNATLTSNGSAGAITPQCSIPRSPMFDDVRYDFGRITSI